MNKSMIGKALYRVLGDWFESARVPYQVSENFGLNHLLEVLLTSGCINVKRLSDADRFIIYGVGWEELFVDEGTYAIYKGDCCFNLCLSGVVFDLLLIQIIGHDSGQVNDFVIGEFWWWIVGLDPGHRPYSLSFPFELSCL